MENALGTKSVDIIKSVNPKSVKICNKINKRNWYYCRHLEAVIKSFDPGNRGWLSAGQMRRIYATLGLTPEESCEERCPYNTVLEEIKKAQEVELFDLLSAGMPIDIIIEDLKSDTT